MQVDRSRIFGKPIEEPHHVPRLGLGGGAGTHIALVITRSEGAAYRIGSEIDHPAELWRPSMVVFVPPAARGQWTPSAHG